MQLGRVKEFAWIMKAEILISQMGIDSGINELSKLTSSILTT